MHNTINTILLGNIIATIGCVLLVIVGFIKDKKQILVTQCGLYIAFGAANLIVSGPTGAVTNFVSIIRNVVYFKDRDSKLLKYIFAFVFLLASFLVSKSELMGSTSIIYWFPAFSGVVYSLLIDEKDEIKLKYWIIIAQIFWLVYDFKMKLFTSFFFDITAVLSNLIGIERVKNDRKKKAIEGESQFDK